MGVLTLRLLTYHNIQRHFAQRHLPTFVSTDPYCIDTVISSIHFSNQSTCLQRPQHPRRRPRQSKVPPTKVRELHTPHHIVASQSHNMVLGRIVYASLGAALHFIPRRVLTRILAMITDAIVNLKDVSRLPSSVSLTLANISSASRIQVRLPSRIEFRIDASHVCAAMLTRA